jgi:hypothetical protein
MRGRGTILGCAVALVALLALTACGGSGSAGGGTAASTRAPVEDIDMQAADFPNINTMTKVDTYFVTNLLGHEQEALAVARSPKGGKFPVGTLLQLVPQEAMVKRRPGWNPATHDWEFFFLDTSPSGTKILTRGAEEVVNRFGDNCASCHTAAEPRWDLVCSDDHGCEPLPIGRDLITQIQAADPRPR